MSERLFHGTNITADDYLFSYIRPRIQFCDGKICKVDYNCIPCRFPPRLVRCATNEFGEETEQEIPLTFNPNSCSWVMLRSPEGCGEDDVPISCPELVLAVGLTCTAVMQDGIMQEGWTLTLLLTCCPVGTIANQSVFHAIIQQPCLALAGITYTFPLKECTGQTECSEPLQFEFNGQNLCNELRFKVIGSNDCDCLSVDERLAAACESFSSVTQEQPAGLIQQLTSSVDNPAFPELADVLVCDQCDPIYDEVKGRMSIEHCDCCEEVYARFANVNSGNT